MGVLEEILLNVLPD